MISGYDNLELCISCESLVRVQQNWIFSISQLNYKVQMQEDLQIQFHYIISVSYFLLSWELTKLLSPHLMNIHLFIFLLFLFLSFWGLSI